MVYECQGNEAISLDRLIELNMKMQSSSAKHWFQLPQLSELSDFDIEQLLLICGRLLILRTSKADQGAMTLEVYCTPGEELAEAEALLRRTAADIVLRKKIEQCSSSEITNLVDSILKRASGG